MQIEPVCSRCGNRVPFTINQAVSLTAHYEDYHPSVPFLRQAAEIVEACNGSRSGEMMHPQKQTDK
jgi:hypothetical protein